MVTNSLIILFTYNCLIFKKRLCRNQSQFTKKHILLVYRTYLPQSDALPSELRTAAGFNKNTLKSQKTNGTSRNIHLSLDGYIIRAPNVKSRAPSNPFAIRQKLIISTRSHGHFDRMDTHSSSHGITIIYQEKIARVSYRSSPPNRSYIFSSSSLAPQINIHNKSDIICDYTRQKNRVRTRRLLVIEVKHLLDKPRLMISRR